MPRFLEGSPISPDPTELHGAVHDIVAPETDSGDFPGFEGPHFAPSVHHPGKRHDHPTRTPSGKLIQIVAPAGHLSLQSE